MADELERLKRALAGRYRVQRELGRGGMATVYLAHDLKHDRSAALKVLKAELAAALGAERFLREITLTARFDHPHILPLLDSGEADGLPYYVMPYVEGESLRDRLHREKQLPLDDALQITREVADALSYAHSLGIVHRDIKPENILLATGHARVADFGIARAVTAAGGQSLTETGLAVGTPAYMSPEQASGEREVDARTDVYSLACVVYEMLAGQPPFTGATAEAILARKSLEAVPSLRVVREAVPAGVEQAITRALARVPADRFVTASQFAEALERGRAAVSPLAPTRHRVPRRRLVIAAGAVLGALTVAWWGVMWLRPPSPHISSLAVLPLKNLMGDPEQDYFVEGMYEALTAELSKIGALKVISRTSAMRYRDTDKAMPQIARELGVEGLIEGSVLREGDQVRITVQLIHGPTDNHLWADSYQRELRGVLALHSEVAQAIATEIKLTLTRPEQARLARSTVVNPEAYERFLRGQHFLRQYSAAAATRAIEHFMQAADEDPTFAPAYAGLAQSYGVLVLWGGVPSLEVAAERKAAAMKAVQLDPLLAEAHGAAAGVSFFDWEWAAAERHMQRALELNPNSSALHDWYGYYLECMGRFDEAIAHRHRALELDPFAPAMNEFLSYAYLRARRHEEAIHHLKKALDLFPNYHRVHAVLSVAYALTGAREQALHHSDRALALSPAPDDPSLLGLVGWVYGVTGTRSKASELLDQLNRQATQTYVDPFWLTFILVGLDDKDRAIESITRAVTQRSPGVVDLMVEPMWDPLRDDSRFQELLRRMNFPEPPTLRPTSFDYAPRPNTAMKLSRASVGEEGVGLFTWPSSRHVPLPVARRAVTRAAYGQRR